MLILPHQFSQRILLLVDRNVLIEEQIDAGVLLINILFTDASTYSPLHFNDASRKRVEKSDAYILASYKQRVRSSTASTTPLSAKCVNNRYCIGSPHACNASPKVLQIIFRNRAVDLKIGTAGFYTYG